MSLLIFNVTFDQMTHLTLNTTSESNFAQRLYYSNLPLENIQSISISYISRIGQSEILEIILLNSRISSQVIEVHDTC